MHEVHRRPPEMLRARDQRALSKRAMTLNPGHYPRQLLLQLLDVGLVRLVLQTDLGLFIRIICGGLRLK